jgi:hypothetical protein
MTIPFFPSIHSCEGEGDLLRAVSVDVTCLDPAGVNVVKLHASGVWTLVVEGSNGSFHGRDCTIN